MDGILSGVSGGSGVVRYQHDDGTFDSIWNPDTYVGEYAMRYDLAAAGTIVWLEACFELASNAAVQDYVFDFVVYADETRTIWDESNQVYDRGSRPGDVLSGPATVRALLPFSGRDDAFDCVRHSTELAVASGSVWVSVRMPGYGLIRQMRISEADLKVDTRFVSSGDPEWRRRDFFGPDSVSRWHPNHQSRAYVPPSRQAYGIRMGVVHEAGPGASGRLAPGQHTDCHPTTTPLMLDGGYKVNLCYETPRGDVGEAKGELWGSGKAGLLWFFERDNAEVLIKVLDGCSHNNRRWVFVAPVTDVAFNLHVTDSRGLLWTHQNRLGITASPKSDTNFFPCD